MARLSHQNALLLCRGSPRAVPKAPQPNLPGLAKKLGSAKALVRMSAQSMPHLQALPGAPKPQVPHLLQSGPQARPGLNVPVSAPGLGSPHQGPFGVSARPPNQPLGVPGSRMFQPKPISPLPSLRMPNTPAPPQLACLSLLQ